MSKFITIMAIMMAAFFIFAAADDVAMAMGGRGRGGHGGGGDHGKGGGWGKGGKHGGAIPEIDPGMASSAIALLSCGVLILRSKRKS
ncbi:MAG: hypothetical protein QME78_11110 [Thermodesulfobacteriota bacterium]|nr:hypothetical protein [Thermodesulfobacteriota bacterium]